ncbi:low-density lipoprotein receptor-related protein 8 [Eurytemora carolleeae]|uniref:low-density lipoprotein receptor-related protein 8 n=1 Tax=Eurytemora carolleeae TaxID=1294199 RepID=UPI000C787DFA|nr:low-density lipoprotein receptor-related protein 8 [Eurytemora carolleeae]|eukprot:XP_023347365.1 low-density lipoprotein receptor-related protein 8-like [Eurytemora affinis]
MSSVIFYEMDIEKWVWYSRKDNKSMATISALETTLLLGLRKVDFSGVINDACTDGGTPFADIKFSTCKQDQFTCYDGQCIDIEHRCDENTNCADKSDEEDCRMIYMKENYKKTVAPFRKH